MNTCKTCGNPIHWVENEQHWYHDDLRDTLYCQSVDVEPIASVEV